MQHDAILFPTECPCGSIANRAEKAFDAGNAIAYRLHSLWCKLEGQHIFTRTSSSKQALSGILDLAVQILKRTVHSMVRSTYSAILSDADVSDKVRAVAAIQIQRQEQSVKNSQAILYEERHFAPASHTQRFLESVNHRIAWALDGKMRELQHREVKCELMKAVRDSSTLIIERIEKARQAVVEKIHEHGGKADFERNVDALEELLQEAASLAVNDEHHRIIHATKASNMRNAANHSVPIMQRVAAMGHVATDSMHELASSARLALNRTELALHME
jgi:hypothetical protein